MGGDLIGDRYLLEELIGRGGMADVYRARDRRLDRAVAVKVFRFGGDPEAARRLVAEARLLAPLDHRGVVAVSDGSVDESRPFLVMPLVTGGTLAGRLTSGPLPVAETIRLGRELADTLAYLHERGIVHRDMKPSNILLDEDGRPVLSDFGVSRLVDSTRATTTGQLVGTAAYLAPEQVRGGETGPAADVYALGLVLLECLTGRRVYAGTNQVGVATARLHHEAEVPDHLPDGFHDLLSGMVRTDPGQRPTAAGCVERLAAVAVAPPDPDATIALPLVVRSGGRARAPERTGPFRGLVAVVERAARRPALAASALALMAAAAGAAAVLPFTVGAGAPPPERIVHTGGPTASTHPRSPAAAVSPKHRHRTATSRVPTSAAPAPTRAGRSHGAHHPHHGPAHHGPADGHGHGHGQGHGRGHGHGPGS